MTLVSEIVALAARIRTEVNSIKTSLASKAPLASPAFTGTPTGITKTHVGLGNVDNTSDANKPVSTAQQTALDGKVSDTGDTMTGVLTLPSLRMPPTVGTASGRFGGLPGVEAWVGMFVNAAFNGAAWVLDDTSKPGWFFKLDSRASSPEFAVYRIPSGPNPHTDEVPLFKVNTTGLMTVAGRVTGVSDATTSTDAVPLGQADGRYAPKGSGSAVPVQPAAPAAPAVGTLWFDDDDPGPGNSGPSYTPYTPTLTGFTASSYTARYMKQGTKVDVWGYLSVATATGVLAVSLPFPTIQATSQPVGTWSVLDVGTTRYNGTVQIKDASSFYFFPDGPAGSPSALSNTLPMAWAPNDVLAFSITYEAAS